MPRFAYLAIDPKGAERRGAIEVAGEAQARERLAQRQWRSEEHTSELQSR